MHKHIPYGRQDISDEDISEAVKVLQSDYLTQGPEVPKFEESIREYVNSKYAYAVNSATSALHISCLALEVGKDDIVWTSANTFVASAHCALYCDAEIDFIDIDKKTNNICVEELSKKLLRAKENNKLPKVIIPVHLGGNSCDMKSISKLSKLYNFKIIEDASHSIGASYDNSKVGSCKYSDITVFSFHPVKIITTCEGGVAITNDAKIAKRLDLFRTHGITKDFAEMHTAAHGPWYYEQLCLGLNYRMTEIQATIGRSQLKRVDDFVSRRNALATIYDAEISKEYFEFSVLNDLSYSSYHLYVIKLKDIFDRKDHRLFFEHLRDQNIGVNIHYIPVHFHPYYKKLGFNVGDFPNAENYYHRAISIPLFYGLEEEEQLYVIDKVNNYFK